MNAIKLRSLLSLLLLPAGFIVLTACGSASAANSAASGAGSPGQELKLQFATSPAAIKTGAPVSLSATLTRGNRAVQDADVVLEIWKADQPDGDHIQQQTKYDPAGGYVLKGSFVEAGVYYVLVHATTAEAHQMISAKFEVRDGS